MPAAERKRPWYLVLALLGALALGTKDLRSGWTTVALYRGSVDIAAQGDGIADEDDRTALVSRVRAYVQALDAAKQRGWPLGVATFLLGGAVFIFAIRALGGSRGARTVLVQLVLAQTGVYAAGYWLLRDVSDAELRVLEAQQAAQLHEQFREHPAERVRADDMARKTSAMLHAATPVLFGFRLLASALVVVALTRRRSREYFDGAREAVEER